MAYKKNEKKLREYFVKTGDQRYIQKNDAKQSDRATKEVRPRPQAVK